MMDEKDRRGRIEGMMSPGSAAAAIQRAEQRLAELEASLLGDPSALAAAFDSSDGRNWRQAASLLADASLAAAIHPPAQPLLEMALGWLDTLHNRLAGWQRRLQPLYSDILWLDSDDPQFAADLEALVAKYKIISEEFWDRVYDPRVSEDLHQLAFRFDAELRPLIPSGFDGDRIQQAFDTTLGHEQLVIGESRGLFHDLHQDIRQMRRSARQDDQAGLEMAQEAAGRRIVAYRLQVDATLQQLSEARAALRAALESLPGPEPDRSGEWRPAFEQQRLQAEQQRLQDLYDLYSRRIAALDTDISRALDSLTRQVLEERRADYAAQRNEIATALSLIEEKWTQNPTHLPSRSSPASRLSI